MGTSNTNDGAPIMNGYPAPGRRSLLALLLVLPLAAIALACDRSSNSGGSSSSAKSSASANPSDPLPASKDPTVDLLFTYGSEKKAWINDVTSTFNAGDHRTAGGKRIR